MVKFGIGPPMFFGAPFACKVPRDVSHFVKQPAFVFCLLGFCCLCVFWTHSRLGGTVGHNRRYFLGGLCPPVLGGAIQFSCTRARALLKKKHWPKIVPKWPIRGQLDTQQFLEGVLVTNTSKVSPQTPTVPKRHPE